MPHPLLVEDGGQVVGVDPIHGHGDDATGRSVRELVLEAGLMTPEELDKALDLKGMTKGGLR